MCPVPPGQEDEQAKRERRREAGLQLAELHGRGRPALEHQWLGRVGKGLPTQGVLSMVALVVAVELWLKGDAHVL